MTQAYYSYLCSMRPESQTLLYRVWFPFCKTNLHWEYINCTIYWYSTVLWRSWFSLPESQYVGRLLVCLLLMLVWWLSRTLSVFGCDSNWFIWYLGWLWPYHLLHFTIHGTMWGAHMVFLEILMCSLRVRPLHDHYMVVLSYFSTDGGKVWYYCWCPTLAKSSATAPRLRSSFFMWSLRIMMRGGALWLCVISHENHHHYYLYVGYDPSSTTCTSYYYTIK